MSYHDFHARRGYRGFGASNPVVDLQATIQGKLPPVAGGMPLPDPQATLNQIIQTSPTASSIASDWAPALDAVASVGVNFGDISKSPGKAVEVMMGALPTVLDAAGVGGTAADIASIAQGFAPQVGALIDGHPGPLVLAGIKTGAAYGCKELGIPPDIGNITIDAIMSGEISDETLIAAGGMGGAVGGSAICSLIGIPPCIGGYIGGLAGKFVGGAIADILHIGMSKAERERLRQERLKLESAIRGQLNSMRQAYVNLISASRAAWWAKFDHVVDNVSLQWQALECAGLPPQKPIQYARFPLLWQGRGTVNPWFVYPFNKSGCTRPINQNLSRGTGCLNAKGILANVTEGGCPEPYGCPYPTFPYTFGAGAAIDERVLQAFAAYDVWWVPDSDRKAIDDQWLEILAKPDSRPHDSGVANHAAMYGLTWTQAIANRSEQKKSCSSHACRVGVDNDVAKMMGWYKDDLTATAAQALSLDGVNAALLRITGDLTTTAGIYAAAASANAMRSAMAQKNLLAAVAKTKSDAELIVRLNREYKESIQSGKRKNGLINYGMLAAGVLLAGGAMYATRKS